MPPPGMPPPGYGPPPGMPPPMGMMPPGVREAMLLVGLPFNGVAVAMVIAVFYMGLRGSLICRAAVIIAFGAFDCYCISNVVWLGAIIRMMAGELNVVEIHAPVTWKAFSCCADASWYATPGDGSTKTRHGATWGKATAVTQMHQWSCSILQLPEAMRKMQQSFCWRYMSGGSLSWLLTCYRQSSNCLAASRTHYWQLVTHFSFGALVTWPPLVQNNCHASRDASEITA